MPQQDYPSKIANDIENFIPSPIRKIWSKYSGAVDKVSGKGGSSTDSGKLPSEWEEANRKSIEQQLAKPVGKKAVQKAVKKRTAPLANKRTPRKRSN